jgi:hypothetical protein
VVVLARRQCLERRFAYCENRSDIERGGVDAVDTSEFDEKLFLVLAACFDLVRRVASTVLEENFDTWKKRSGVRVESIELQPTIESVSGDDFTEGNKGFSHRRQQ